MNAFVFTYAIGLHGEKQCFQTIKTKMKEVKGKIYILYNSRYRLMRTNNQGHGHIIADSLAFNVLTYV